MKKFALLPLLLVVACNGSGSDSPSTETSSSETPATAVAGPTWNAVAGVSETLTGRTANDRDSTAINAECLAGHIPNASHATIHVAAPGAYTVGAVSANGTDLTLAIQGPNGTYFCDDDGGEGFQPLIQDTFPAGDYQVFVGTFSDDEASSFTLTLTPGPAAAAPAVPTPTANGGGGATAGTYGDVAVAAGFASTTLTGAAGGPNNANTMGPTCVGQINGVPDHILHIQNAQQLNITVTSQADTTLVVQGPGGTFCNDDDNGLNPGIHQAFTPGDYNVFVGVLFGAETPAYSLTVAP